MNASSNFSFQNQTFDEFFDSIGDVWIIDVIYLYIFPLIGVIGTIFNIINIWIFSQREFSMPYFFYFRVLSAFYLIDTILVIGYGICYSPRLLPKVNTELTVLVQLIYVPIGELFLNNWVLRLTYIYNNLNLKKVHSYYISLVS